LQTIDTSLYPPLQIAMNAAAVNLNVRPWAGCAGSRHSSFSPSLRRRHHVQKKGATIFLPLTLPHAIADRLTKFFHRQTFQCICGKGIIKYPTTPQMRHYTNLVKCLCSKMAMLQLIGANCHAKVSTLLLTDEKIFTAAGGQKWGGTEEQGPKSRSSRPEGPRRRWDSLWGSWVRGELVSLLVQLGLGSGVS